MIVRANEPEQWFGCYDGTRRDLFLPASNAHPAKMSVALCYRIFAHGERMGYWSKGDHILDPMAGQFTTGIVGASMGFRVTGIELEKHFIEMSLANIDLLMRKMPEAPRPALIHGDARRLSELLGRTDAVVSSPPYSDAQGHPSLGSVNKDDWGKEGTDIVARRGLTGKYDAAITSPPYFQAGGGGINLKGYGPDGADKVGDRTYSDRTVSGAITSPPYSQTMSVAKKRGKRADNLNASKGIHPNLYGRGGAQIGNLKDPIGDIDGVLSSPPYENSDPAAHRRQTKLRKEWCGRGGDGFLKAGQQSSEGNAGGMTGDTYLSAMLTVYRELARVLKPKGVAVLVTKNPVKAGKIRRLDLDTIRLMEAAGFILIEHKHAMLREDLGEQGALLGPAKVITRERKSFFKRLHERKRPDLAVNFEDVLFFLRNTT